MEAVLELEGRRVLIAEDDAMISMMIEDMLTDLGCLVVGPAHTLEAAMGLAATGSAIDVALLDVNLAGKSVFPVADVLRARGVPMVFCTGYGDAGLRPDDRATPMLLKPYREEQLLAALATALESGRA
jgi:CheY-like chemotaxis protein